MTENVTYCDKHVSSRKCIFFVVVLAYVTRCKLSQTQSPTTAEDREKMKVIPYASAIGSIMYAMLCTRPDVCLAISLAGRYKII